MLLSRIRRNGNTHTLLLIVQAGTKTMEINTVLFYWQLFSLKIQLYHFWAYTKDIPFYHKYICYDMFIEDSFITARRRKKKLDVPQLRNEKRKRDIFAQWCIVIIERKMTT